MLRLCVAGATGRMGSTLIGEAVDRGFQIVGAVVAPGEPNIGKTLEEAGVCRSSVRIVGPDRLREAARPADIYMTFTTPGAEAENLPVVAGLGKRIVMGTTGHTGEQMAKLREAVMGRVPAVFAPNFALGVNLLFRLAKACGALPADYDFSIVEAHHTGKADAPSGTAKKLAEIVSGERGYSRSVHGREGVSPRKPGELEIMALRLGGVAGIHDLVIAGPHEMIRIEHTAFSRRVFAQGALYAAEWLSRQTEPRIYSMEDVLG